MPRRAPGIAVLLALLLAAALAARTCTDAGDLPGSGADDDAPRSPATVGTASLGSAPRPHGRAKSGPQAAPGEDAPAADPPGARTTSFTAVVLRKDDDAPIAGATVLVADRNGHREFATDAEGRATFDVAPGGVDYGVVAPGRAREQGSLHVGEEPIVRTFRLGVGAAAVGRITDARTGGPIAGATVVVRIGGFDGFSTYHWAGDWEVGHATTDADGRFAIEGMAPGVVFSLHASAAGHADGERPATPYAPGRCTCDLALEPGRTIRGVVLAPDGSPAAGVVVTCRPAWVSPVQHGPFGDGAQVLRSDERGAFAFPNLDGDGTYALRASADAGGLRVADRTAPPGTDDVSLRFEPDATLVVRVVGQGPAWPSGHASVERLAPLPDGSDLPDVATDGSESVALSPGRYRVRLDEVDCDPAPTADVVLAAGATTTCEIRVEPATYEGLVVDERGTPLGGVRVTLREGGALRREFERQTGDDGRFVVRGLAAGRHRLGLERDGLSVVSDTVDVPSEARTWKLPAESLARIRLPPAATGRDVHVSLDLPAEGGDEGAVEGWRLDQSTTSASPYDPSDPFLVFVAATGRVRFRVRVQGFVTARAEGVAPGGGEFAVDVPDLVAGVAVEGRVVDPEGAPVPAAAVAVADPRDPRHGVVADFQGRFVSETVAAGPVRLSVQPRGGFLPRTVAVIASPGAREPVTIVLHRGGVVDVTLLDGSGHPVTSRDLDVTDEGGEPSAWAVRTDHRGRARIRLNPGRHRIAGEGVERADVTVAEGETQSVRLAAR